MNTQLCLNAQTFIKTHLSTLLYTSLHLYRGPYILKPLPAFYLCLLKEITLRKNEKS